MSDQKKLREHLRSLLGGGGAHIDFDRALEGFPLDLAGKRIPGLDHTAWMLIYHLRIAQWDILEFSINPAHTSPEYPAGYWPGADAPSTGEEWRQTVASFRADLQATMDLVADEGNDLVEPFAHGSGQTLLREALLAADHNAYHIGQLVDIRMLLGVPVRDY